MARIEVKRQRMKKLKISVVIPAYNAAKDLQKSLPALKPSEYEVIVVDDGSTDNTSEVARSFGCKAIKLDKNVGAAKARNTGARAAKGEVILFLDADVELQKGSIEELRKVFSRKEVEIVQGVYTEKSAGDTVYSKFKDLYYSFYFHKSGKYCQSVSTHCFAIRRNLFLSLGCFEEKIRRISTEDAEFYYKVTDRKILLDWKVKVKHLKVYNLKGFLKTDYNIARGRVKSLFRKRPKKIVNIAKDPFDALRMSFAILLAPLTLLALPRPTLSLVFFTLYMLLNIRFFHKIYKQEKSAIYSMVILSFLNSITICFGAALGLLDLLRGQRY